MTQLLGAAKQTVLNPDDLLSTMKNGKRTDYTDSQDETLKCTIHTVRRKEGGERHKDNMHTRERVKQEGRMIEIQNIWNEAPTARGERELPGRSIVQHREASVKSEKTRQRN